MLGGERREVTSLENLISGLGAGMSSGLVGGPAELMMIQQQVKGGSILQRAKEIGPRVFRGLFPTAMREGSCIYLCPAAAECLSNTLDKVTAGVPKDRFIASVNQIS